MPEEQSNKTLRLKRFLPLIIIASLMAVAFATGLHEKLSLDALQTHKGDLFEMVTMHPVLSAMGFIGVYVLAVALSLPVATILTLTGGFMFGKWLGTLYVVSAATLGASIIFLVAKTALGKILREKAGGMYARVEKNMKENATGYLLFMRLVPIFPFFLVNIIPALFNVRLRVFVLTTFFGILPGSFVFVNLGEQLGEIESLGDLVSMKTLFAFALLGFFALIPTLYKQFKTRKNLAVIMLSLVLAASSVQAGDYDELLSEYVHKTEKNGITYNGVDYDAWAKDARHAASIKRLTQTNPNDFETQNEEMSFWINAYNLLTIDLIVKKEERESIKNLGSFFTTPWKKHQWLIAGQAYTLDKIEHAILRSMKDPRIHFAINCASVSCPDLRDEAYEAKSLNRQLNEQVMITLANEGKGFAKNDGTVHVSKIFDWFSEDFNNGDVKGWLQSYVSFNTNKKLQYMNYDWSLNKGKRDD
ncbi:MAG: hypothetical protein COA45_12255 [Zetaproteobacteria bacterium]|nr:MAG: hypothetical protein COA45_12255 [Zetaproteobacteria bacterium]